MPRFYTRRLHSDNFSPPDKWDIDNKIAVFEDYVSGWQLEPAEDVATKVSDSGFAVLRIVLAYFEMIAKYRDGYDKSDRSAAFFEEGIKFVFDLAAVPHNAIELFTKNFYKEGRCALYHSGMSGFGVALKGDLGGPLAIHKEDGSLIIDPLEFVRGLRKHFSGFCKRLKDPAEKDLRANFEKRFDYEFKE
jgi:hypothetical protein